MSRKSVSPYVPRGFIHRTFNVDFPCMLQSREDFVDIKGVIKIRKSKKDRQHNGQKKKDKRTNNDPDTTHKTTDRGTRTQLKT
jgi:hypothetical protein